MQTRTHRSLSRLLGLLALALMLLQLGCGNKGVKDDVKKVTGDRTLYPVTVFTNDTPSGNSLLGAVRALGYTHPNGEVLGNPNDEFNIKWGSAPLPMVQELAAMVRERFGREVRMLQVFEPGDTDIFINIPLGGAPQANVPTAPVEVTRSSINIVVFCDQNQVGVDTLARLAALGYDNPENSTQGAPNSDFNIKWGAAPEALVEEMVRMLEGEFGTSFNRLHEFAADDLDVFINLPVTGI